MIEYPDGNVEKHFGQVSPEVSQPSKYRAFAEAVFAFAQRLTLQEQINDSTLVPELETVTFDQLSDIAVLPWKKDGKDITSADYLYIVPTYSLTDGWH